ncbi:hypothetical protein AAFF_G00190650, partial [Aldrovandia affinis]
MSNNLQLIVRFHYPSICSDSLLTAEQILRLRRWKIYSLFLSKSLGLSQLEKKRFGNMQTHIERLYVIPVKKSMEAFRVMYRFPKCPEPKEISDMDPSQNTLEDLMLRIGFLEKIGNDKAVCLYSVEGMPLTDDPFFNTWSLKERHIENGIELYAIFTPKESLQFADEIPLKNTREIPGVDTVRCHIMLK